MNNNASHPLHRATSGRMVAGVAAGLADYLGADVTVIRLAFALAAVLGSGAGVVAYLAFALLLPDDAGQSLASSLLASAQGRR